MLQVLLPIVLTIILVVTLYLRRTYTHWTRNGILQVEPNFPFGNMKDLLLKRDTFGHTFKVLYDHFKQRQKPVGGYYFVIKPELVIVDIELIKCVLTRDFTHFSDRGLYIDEKNDPISANLFSLPGTKWRPIRAKLTPTFTSGKMKMMFQTLLSCALDLKQVLNQSLAEPVDIKDILSRYTIDVIGSCGFGIDCDSLKNPQNEFRKHSTKIIQPEGLDVVRQMLAISIPDIMSFLGIPGFSPTTTNFFLNVVKQTISYREENQVERNDFMQLLIDLKKSNELTVNQIAAQCFAFFLAGFETSSTTMTFCLFELALDEQIQNDVRSEILKVLKKYDDVVTYDAIMEMHYLDKCVFETLRKYPPLPFINREVTEEWQVPDTSCILTKGTPVVISVEGLHWDPEFYPEPDKFDPERFSEDEKAKRPQYSYLPFGEGPRICIGLRFGLMQTKVGLVEVLRNFKCTVNEKTRVPLEMTTSTFITATEGGIWLNIEKIS